MGKEPLITQPTVDEQREYLSAINNDATVVTILGTNKKYKVRWLKNIQVEYLSRLLVRKAATDDQDKEKDEPLNAIIEDAKLGCKAAAITVLNGYWSLKFKYWFLWRWFYYIRQYDNAQLQPLLDEMKKKIPLVQFLVLTTCLTGAKVSLMNMRTEEAEHILQGLATEQQAEMENLANG